jgi:hypothetical protein
MDIKYDRSQLSDDAWRLIEKYGLDRDHDWDLDGADQAATMLDQLSHNPRLSPSEVSTAQALLAAFKDPSQSPPRNDDAARELAPLDDGKQLSTKEIQALSPTALANATLKERDELLRAVIDDFFVFKKSEGVVLALLASTPEHQRPILANLLHFETYKGNTSVEDRLIKKLGGLGDERARATAFFNEHFYTYTSDLTLDQRWSRLDATLKVGIKKPADSRFLADLLINTPASDEAALLAKVAPRLDGLWSSNLADEDRGRLRDYFFAHLHLLGEPTTIVKALGLLVVKSDAQAEAAIASLRQLGDQAAFDIVRLAVSKGALSPALVPVGDMLLSATLQGETTPEIVLKTIAQVQIKEPMRLASFIERLTATRGAPFANRILGELNADGTLTRLLPCLSYAPPADLDEFSRIVNDAPYRKALFAAHEAAFQAFSAKLPAGDTKTKLAQSYGKTHELAALSTKLRAAVEGCLTSGCTPILTKWRDELTAAGAAPDKALYDQMTSLAHEGTLTRARLAAIVEKCSADGFSQAEQLAFVQALLDAGLVRLFGRDFGAVEYVLSASPFRFDKVAGSGGLVVWRNENNTASGGETIRVRLPEPVQCTPDGLRTKYLQVVGKEVQSSAEGLQPFAASRGVTADGFDQVQALWAANGALSRVTALGIDLGPVLKDSHNSGFVRIEVNGMRDLNAYFDPMNNLVRFGTGDGKLHLASDMDVVTHEVGHDILSHLAHELSGSGEASAIQEGFADGFASLSFDDAEISEDMGPAVKQACLRNVDNDLTLSKAGSECHDRGQVYGGYIWSLKEELVALGLTERDAANTALAMIIRHASFYAGEVSSTVFTTAMAKAANAVLGSVLPKDKAKACLTFMRNEAIKRELVKPEWQLPPTERRTVLPGLAIADAAGRNTAALAKLRSTLPPALAELVEFDLVAENTNDVRSKLTYQAMIRDEQTGERLPIEDGTASFVFEQGALTQVSGPGLHLPEAIDLTRPPLEPEVVEPLVKGPLHDYFVSNGLANQRLSDYLVAHFDALFAGAAETAQEVVYKGAMAYKITCPAGEFTLSADGKQILAGRVLVL